MSEKTKKIKKIPQRKCIACGEHKDKKDLVRVVKNKEGEIFLDKTFKANGRGAYLCNDEGCFNKALKAKMLDRAFKTPVDEEVYQSLKEEMMSEK